MQLKGFKKNKKNHILFKWEKLIFSVETDVGTDLRSGFHPPKGENRPDWIKNQGELKSKIIPGRECFQVMEALWPHG